MRNAEEVSPTRTHYEVLGVARDATVSQIRSAYRALVLRHHPDRLGEQAETRVRVDAERRVREVTAAWQVLRDPERRADYDRQLPSMEGADRFSPFPSGTEPEPVGGYEEWFADADRRLGEARVVTRSLARERPPRALLLIGCGFVVLVGIFLIVALAGQGNDEPSTSLMRGDCVRIEQGPQTAVVPCAQRNDGQVVAEVSVVGACPQGSTARRLTVGDTRIACLAAASP